MSMFATFYDLLHSPAGVGVLFAALLLGLWNMFRRPAGNLSQKLMRWRIGLQFAVICAILGMALLSTLLRR